MPPSSPSPRPAIDHGATAHLLGGAAVYQKLSPTSFPNVVAFQGDGYSVAAIAGQSPPATPLDAHYPDLQKSQTTIDAPNDDNTPPYPNLEVADEPNALRVVDTAGAPVDCRHDDTLFIPATDKIVYIIAAGSAEDLMSLLRVASPNRLPVADITRTDTALSLHLKNITTDQLKAKLRLLQSDNTILLEKDLPTLPTQTTIEIPLPTPPDTTKPLTLELTTPNPHGIIQRTTLPTEPK